MTATTGKVVNKEQNAEDKNNSYWDGANFEAEAQSRHKQNGW